MKKLSPTYGDMVTILSIDGGGIRGLIPATILQLQQRIIFCFFGAKQDISKDGYLSDICIATSAAPTYLPAHHFETKYPSGKTREFHLTDGVAANSPVYFHLTFAEFNCINEVTKESLTHPEDWVALSKAKDKRKILVLSLGTGYQTASYKASDVAKWGLWGWVDQKNAMLDTFMQSSGRDGSNDL